MREAVLIFDIVLLIIFLIWVAAAVLSSAWIERNGRHYYEFWPWFYVALPLGSLLLLVLLNFSFEVSMYLWMGVV